MVIREKGLLRAMKDAYKSRGYIVSVDDSNGENEWIIEVPSCWMVRMMQQDMKREILATIVLHLGKLPKPGEAFQVQKSAAQTEIHDVAHSSFTTGTEPVLEIKPTDLYYGQYRLWQRESDNAIVPIHPELERLLDVVGRNVYMHGSQTVSLTGYVSSAFLKIPFPDTKDIDKLDHLAQIRWVPEK